MSRIGRKPIEIPTGVKVEFRAPRIQIQGKQGTLDREVASLIDVSVKGNQVLVSNRGSSEESRAQYGLTRTLIHNMVVGVTEGFSRVLELQGVGYRAQTQGSKLSLSVGYSHPVEFELPKGISATVEANTKIVVKGADKELVGLIAANLRKVKPPEVYKGKGIRYFGEVVSLKQGKTAGGAAGSGAK